MILNQTRPLDFPSLDDTQSLGDLIDLIIAETVAGTEVDTPAVVARIDDLIDLSRYSYSNPKFDEWLRHIGDLHDRKNRGYAGSVENDPLHNFRQSEQFGVPMFVGIAVRLSDKFSRFYSLMKRSENDQVGESLYDLADDIGVYAGLFKLAYQEHLADPRRP